MPSPPDRAIRGGYFAPRDSFVNGRPTRGSPLRSGVGLRPFRSRRVRAVVAESSAVCLLDRRGRCRQQAAQRVAEVVDDLGAGLWIGRDATARRNARGASASPAIAIMLTPTPAWPHLVPRGHDRTFATSRTACLLCRWAGRDPTCLLRLRRRQEQPPRRATYRHRSYQTPRVEAGLVSAGNGGGLTASQL